MPDVTSVLAGLVEEFRDVVPARVVASTVQSARRDLTGQIAPEAMDEMLHRLARYRLSKALSVEC